MADSREDEATAILANEDIETLESLVFHRDRLKFVEENFSTSEEAFWYYHILTLQNRFGCKLTSGSQSLALAWEKVGKVSEVKKGQAIKDLELRQAVIDYAKSTPPVKKQTLKKLAAMIQPEFALQDDGADGKKRRKKIPSEIDQNPDKKSNKSWTHQLLKKTWDQFQLEKRDDLSNVFTACAADFLANQKLNPKQIADFLDLVEGEAPEIPFILQYVRKDLELNDTDFGDREIHYRLRKEDLDLLSKTKACQESENYMKCYAWKLRKITDASYRYDIKARDDYLKSLKNFADMTLSKNSKFNSLRALIMYNWLLNQEKKGLYEKSVLKKYMKIPKDQPYCQTIFTKASPEDFADLDYEVDLIKELDPIIDDEAFIQRALRSVFSTSDDTTSKWKDVVDIKYLRKLYCEIKLTKSQGKVKELRRVYGQFGKYAFQDLCNKVNLELVKSNQAYHEVGDSVSLTVLVKNVPELLVRIFQLDCKEYFLRYGKRISLDVPLDGLAPNYVIKKNFKDTSLLERARTIELTDLKGKRGVFMIEFFGNGVKTRALIRKGEIRYVSKQEFKDENADGGLGYQIQLFDEQNSPVSNGEIFMDGVRYTTGEDGLVFVPFAAKDNPNCPMILEDLDNPGSATIHFFDYKTENYQLECGMFIDRESLIEKHEAQIVVRPTLLLNTVPVSVCNLTNVQLVIETTDAQNFKSKRVLPLTLRDDKETVVKMVVPTELRTVDMKVTCDVYSASQEKYLHLAKEESLTINDIDKTNALADMHLIPRGKYGYSLAVLGKNGEPYKDVVVDIELTHRYFTEKLKYTLKTGADGCIALGRLMDVTVLEASTDNKLIYQSPDEDTKHSWILLHDQVNVPTVVNIRKGEVVRIPFMTGGENPPKIDVYDIDFVKKFPNVIYKNGYIEIRSLPAGTFQAFIRDSHDAQVLIYVSKGEKFGDHVVTNSRICELSEERPLQITDVKGNRQEGYQVQIQGHNSMTRVHILSSHLVPRFSSYSFLASPEIPPSVIDNEVYPGLYGTMQSVSDEFKYIGARQSAAKYSGNLLERPSLLNKRWTTQPPVDRRNPPAQQVKEEKQEAAAASKVRIDKEATYLDQMSKIQFDSSNLEFLKEPSKVHFNLEVDENGIVKIPHEMVSPFQNLLQIIAVDDDNTCLRNVILEDMDQQGYKDVTLSHPLNPDTHWTECREIIELEKNGDQLVIDNFATSEIETYDDLSDVFELYTILGNSDDFSSFKFLTVWNDMTMEQKVQFYDVFACNEVNFYIYSKDRAFFDEVVKPLLESKVQKGFLDLYMTGSKDIEAYAGLTKYQSLNTFERILLASRVKELIEPTLKYLQDAVAGTTNLEQESNALFTAALEAKTRAVDASDAMNLNIEAAALGKLSDEAGIIDQTLEYQETRYYKVSFERQLPGLVPANRFWLDYANFLLTQDATGNFLTKNFHKPHKNLTQMLLGLSVIDLPFRSQVKDASYAYSDDGSAVLTVYSSTLVLSKQIKESVVQTSALAVSTNYFDPEDPSEVVDFELQDKFLTMPLLSQKVYGCRVVITNVSSMTHKVELLSQIPEGSVPVRDGYRTKNVVQKIEPYTTKHSEFFFYFPKAGNFSHFQTRVAKNGKVIGYGKEDPNIQVVDAENFVDTSSWDYFSQKAEKEELLDFLKSSPKVHNVDLNKIAWRMEDEQMFVNTTSILRDRQIYCDSIWAYSLKHLSLDDVKEYLSMNPKMMKLIEPHLDSSVLIDYNSFERQSYQIMEYWPLTSSRSHSMEFKNEFFQAQYRDFLKNALYRSYSRDALTPIDKMTGVYYMLIQNRVKDAQDLFDDIQEDTARAVSAFSYDYLRAYLSFYSDHPRDIVTASNLCDTYLAMTLPPSKAAMWQGVSDYINEIKDASFANDMFDPTTEADILSARAKKLDCEVNQDRTITISYKNVDRVEINFYQTDIEFQFSTAPFREEHSAFNFVMPTDQIALELDKNEKSMTVDLPKTLHDKSSVVEVIGGGMTISKANYDNHLRIEISAKLHQIRVFDKTTNKAISKAYVKVYGQTPDSPDGRFIKDGYTDLRGRFDYATVSTDELQFVSALAILVLSPSAGADVLEISV